MSTRFDSIKNKPHILVVTSKMKVMREFKKFQEALSVRTFFSIIIIIKYQTVTSLQENFDAKIDN